VLLALVPVTPNGSTCDLLLDMWRTQTMMLWRLPPLRVLLRSWM
jgi:hypothetical protein